MSLNKESVDLEYNCGRLLAVADAIERRALYSRDPEAKDIRMTNAIRLFTRFAQNPCETWGAITQKLNPYKQQLGNKGKKLYDLLGEISNKIDPVEFSKLKNMGGSFCLGFDSQRLELFSQKSTGNMQTEEIREGE